MSSRPPAAYCPGRCRPPAGHIPAGPAAVRGPAAAEYVAAERVDEEQRRAAAAGTDRYQRVEGAHRRAFPQAFGQALHGRRLDQRGHRQVDAIALLDQQHEAHRAERGAAEIEEAVADAYPGTIQQLAEESGQGALVVVARGQVLDVRPVLQRQRAQGGVVALAAGGEGEAVDPGEVRRHHVFRQFAAQRLLQFGEIHRLGLAEQEGSENASLPWRSRATTAAPRGRLALGLAHDRQLDLGRLDAEAADLDLGIGAAEPDDLAVAEDAPGSPVR